MKKNTNSECIGRLEAIENIARLLEREVESVRDSSNLNRKAFDTLRRGAAMVAELRTNLGIARGWCLEEEINDQQA